MLHAPVLLTEQPQLSASLAKKPLSQEEVDRAEIAIRVVAWLGGLLGLVILALTIGQAPITQDRFFQPVMAIVVSLGFNFYYCYVTALWKYQRAHKHLPRRVEEVAEVIEGASKAMRVALIGQGAAVSLGVVAPQLWTAIGLAPLSGDSGDLDTLLRLLTVGFVGVGIGTWTFLSFSSVGVSGLLPPKRTRRLQFVLIIMAVSMPGLLFVLSPRTRK